MGAEEGGVREGGAGGGGRCGEGRMKGAAGGERYVNMSQDGCKVSNGNHVCGKRRSRRKRGEGRRRRRRRRCVSDWGRGSKMKKERMFNSSIFYVHSCKSAVVFRYSSDNLYQATAELLSSPAPPPPPPLSLHHSPALLLHHLSPHPCFVLLYPILLFILLLLHHLHLRPQLHQPILLRFHLCHPPLPPSFIK